MKQHKQQYQTNFILPSGTVLDLWEVGENKITDYGAAYDEISRHGCEEFPPELIREINIICDRIDVKYKDGELFTDLKEYQRPLAINAVGQAAIAVTYFAEAYLNYGK